MKNVLNLTACFQVFFDIFYFINKNKNTTAKKDCLGFKLGFKLGLFKSNVFKGLKFYSTGNPEKFKTVKIANGFVFNNVKGFITLDDSNILECKKDLKGFLQRVDCLLKGLKSLNSKGFLEKAENVPIVQDLITNFELAESPKKFAGFDLNK